MRSASAALFCYWDRVCSHVIPHLFSPFETKKCVYCVPGIVLGAETSAEQSDENPCPHEFYILVGGGETICKINTLHTELERDQCYGEKQSSDGGGSKC